MSETTLSDLDELVLTVRDRDSRSYIIESINTYRNRAFRAAIMSTWVAVTYDIISKIRELDIQGDPAASSFVKELNNVIDASARRDPTAISRFQKIESELLENALNKFEFLSPQEFVDLDRLRQDRHLCAHPAFTPEHVLFQPTPELTRTHITHAIVHLLRQPPVQGTNALRRIKNDLLQPSFPSDQDKVSLILEMQYLDHAKSALLKNLVTVFLKVIVRATDPELVGKEDSVLMCLEAVHLRWPSVYAEKMAEQLPLITDGLPDGELKRVFRLLKTDKGVWTLLPGPIRFRLREIALQVDFANPADSYVLNGLELSELKPKLLEAFSRLSDADKESVINKIRRPEFVDAAIGLYAKAGSYRAAEHLCESVILPLCDKFKAHQLEQILDAVARNGQIHSASATPDQLKKLFVETAYLHGPTQEAWQKLMSALISQHGSEDSYYACPGLRTQMEQAGMWPVF